MRRQRRQFTAEQKAELLRRHLEGKVPVSTICNEQGLQPSVFYHWLRQLLANAAVALAPAKGSGGEQRLERRVKALQERVARKDEVIAEVSEELVRLKKELGEP